MTEDTLKARIGELETELELKDREIIEYLSKIEVLEEKIHQMESTITKEKVSTSKKGVKKEGDGAKLVSELEEKEKEVREIKDKMGFLRKEKTQLQQELEKYTKKKGGKGVVIRVEEKREPLDILIKELQTKINKQQALINQLREESKKEEIEALKLKISELNKKLENYELSNKSPSESKTTLKIKAIQEKLKIAKTSTEINSLNKKLAKYKTESLKRKDSKSISSLDQLKKENDNLKKTVNKQNNKIENLNKEISSLKGDQQDVDLEIEMQPTDKNLKALCEDLQVKLTGAKNQISELKNQLNEYKIMKAPVDEDNRDEIINELRNKLEKLTTQYQIKSKIESADIVQVAANEDISLALRVKELKNLLDDLNKQNLQQRLEIASLRKKIP